MSNSQSYSYSTSSYSSSSYSGGGPGQSHAQRYTQTSSSDSDRGTTTTCRYEETGKPTIEDTASIPANAGKRLEGEGAGVGGQGRIEDVSEREDQAQRDREYEERMEEEYAKREG